MIKSVDILDVDDMVLTNASTWLRKKYNIPLAETVTEKFECEFNCSVGYNEHGIPYTLDFNSEQDYLVFVLRWQ